MRTFTAIAAIICSVWIVSVQADTSYTPPPASGGPYPASGVPQNAAGASGAGTSSASAPYLTPDFKPTGQFFFAARQNAKPTYAPSKKGYGPPSKTTVQEIEFTTESFVTSPKPEPESENINEFPSEQQIPDSGTYYVLLPDGRLQKVTYATMPLEETVSRLQSRGEDASSQNVKGYLANVKYQDVEPIRGPVYAYNSAPLIRIYK